MEEQYLFAGNVIAWLGLGCYLFWLMRQAVRLEKRLDRLEALGDD